MSDKSMKNKQYAILFPIMLFAWFFSMLLMISVMTGAIIYFRDFGGAGVWAYLIIPIGVLVQRLTVWLLENLYE